MYKIINDIQNNPCCVNTQQNGYSISIPFDSANTDAKEFAKWLSEGGVPEAAVEGEQVTQEWINQTIALLLPAENT